MEPPLKSFCIACARFGAGDQLGRALAMLATGPYFVIYHAGVLVHARRELHVALALLGLLSSSALSMALKRALKQPRPAATCALLAKCTSHGMPSSHSTVMAFATTTCLLLWLHRRRQQRIGLGVAAATRGKRPANGDSMVDGLARLVQAIEVAGLLALTAAVGYGRVYLGYHSADQVAAGLALGAACAVAWWHLTLLICRRWAGLLLGLAPLRALHFRNTLGTADPHAAEAALFAAPARRAD